MIMCSSQELLAQLGMCNLQTDLANVGPVVLRTPNDARILGTAQALPPKNLGGKGDGPLSFKGEYWMDHCMMREKLQLWCPPGFILYNCITVYPLDIDFFSNAEDLELHF